MNFNRLVYWTHSPAYSHAGLKHPKQPLSPECSDDEMQDEESGMIKHKEKEKNEMKNELVSSFSESDKFLSVDKNDSEGA